MLILHFCLFFLLATHSALLGYVHQLSVCALFQDEAPYLKEWIEYHRLIGVDHFYLTNHLSKDGYREILAPYLATGIVELVDELSPAEDNKTYMVLQRKCYDNCIAKARGMIKWVAFIDLDEFIVPMQKDSLLELLADYEEFGGLTANWWMFGTSHVKELPKDKLLIEALTHCSNLNYQANRHIKTILRPERARRFISAHDAEYLPNYFQVNSDKMPFEGRFCPYMRTNKIRINHYWTRHETYFFNQKIPRQIKWGGSPNASQLLQELNASQDSAILRFVPKLKERMAFK